MSRQAANITSIDAVRALKAALQQFAADVNDALVMLGLECRRPVDWIENDRSQYWPKAVHKAADAVGEARIVLERCELSSTADEHRSCVDEKKALDKAKRRLRFCEAKIQTVQQWRFKIRKEVEEFQVQVSRLNHYMDNDLLRSMAALDRMSESLDRYVQRSGPSGAETDTSESTIPPASTGAASGEVSHEEAK